MDNPVIVIWFIFGFISLFAIYLIKSLIELNKVKKNARQHRENNVPSSSINYVENNSNTLFTDEAKNLMNSLSSVFFDSEISPTKSDFVKLQKFSTLISQSEVRAKIDEERACELLRAGLNLIDDVYGKNPVGMKRATAIDEALLRMNPDQSKKNKKSSKAAGVKATAGKFGLPFDVEAFARGFPAGWKLVQEYDSEERTILYGPDDSHIFAAPHKISPNKNLGEHVRAFARISQSNSELVEYKTNIGTKFWSLSYEYDHDGEKKPAFMVEVMGPALMSVRFIYIYENIDQKVIDELIQSVEKLIWYSGLPQTDQKSKTLSIDDLRHLICKELKGEAGQEQRDYLLSIFEDEEYINISPFEIEDLIELGPEYYSLAKSIIRFALENAELSVSDLCVFVKMCDIGCLNDNDLQMQLITKAEKEAATTSDFLSLVEIANVGASVKKSSSFYYRKATESVASIDDAYHVITDSLTDGPAFRKLFKVLLNNINNEDFTTSEYNAVDCLNEAETRGFIDHDQKREYLESLVQSSSTFLSFMSMAASLHDVELKDIRESFIKIAMKLAETADDKNDIYKFLKDVLDDQEHASEYFSKNQIELSALQQQQEKAEQQDEIIDAICQCALLVAAGDGSISEDESEEVERIRAFVEVIFRNQDAIELLEKTEDIEKARMIRSDTSVVHTLSPFNPPYHRELMAHLQEIESNEDFLPIVTRYAAKVEDPFARKIAAWAAQEAAAVDGPDEGQLEVLSTMTDLWKVSLKDSNRFINEVVVPLIDDDIEFDGKPLTDDELLDMAKNLDQQLKVDGHGELAESIAESLGVTNMEELARKISKL